MIIVNFIRISDWHKDIMRSARTEIFEPEVSSHCCLVSIVNIFVINSSQKMWKSESLDCLVDYRGLDLLNHLKKKKKVETSDSIRVPVSSTIFNPQHVKYTVINYTIKINSNPGIKENDTTTFMI